jgi:hypothetical protein
MIKAQRVRDQKLADERSAREKTDVETRAADEAKAQGERMEQDYKAALAGHASTVTAESHPTSAAWFGQDHEDYAESLLHTARNMAHEATRAGKVADLSPTNVAAVLEKHMAIKATRFREPLGLSQTSSKPTQMPAPVSKPNTAPVKQPGLQDKTDSNPGLSQTSTKTPVKLSDEERIRRAAAVAFKTE